MRRPSLSALERRVILAGMKPALFSDLHRRVKFEENRSATRLVSRERTQDGSHAGGASRQRGQGAGRSARGAAVPLVVGRHQAGNAQGSQAPGCRVDRFDLTWAPRSAPVRGHRRPCSMPASSSRKTSAPHPCWPGWNARPQAESGCSRPVLRHGRRCPSRQRMLHVPALHASRCEKRRDALSSAGMPLGSPDIKCRHTTRNPGLPSSRPCRPRCRRMS